MTGETEKLKKSKKIITLFSLVFAVFLAASFLSCTAVKNKKWDTASVTEKKYAAFALQVDSFLTESNFQGVVLVGRGNKIVFAKGYGPCDKKQKKSLPIDINKSFEAGSITKQMTAAAIMQLCEKKLISVDDKLSRFFPDYEHGQEITIKMLLNMRSGLTDHINCADDFFPTSIYRHIEKNQLACKPLDENLVLTYFYDAPLLASPDSTYFYCNTNYYLLARIIEMVSGLSYSEYMQTNIFDKCGMTNSNVQFQATDTKGYDYKGRYYSIPASLALGCGDVNSTAVDLFKWNVMFAGGKVVSKRSLKKMIDTQSYGFGIYRKDDIIFHAGTTNVFNSYDMYSFDDKLSVIVLSNCPVTQINATMIAGNIKKMWKK